MSDLARAPDAPDSTERIEIRLLGDPFDGDGDGLVDLEVSWTEGIDRGTLSILSSRPLSPSQQRDLTVLFEVEEIGTSMRLHETTGDLLPSGRVAIVAQANDQHGREVQARLVLKLPILAFHARIPSESISDIGDEAPQPTGLAVLPGDGLGFAIVSGSGIFSFDPSSPETGSDGSKIFPLTTTDVEEALYDPVTDRLFVTTNSFGPVLVIDPATLTVETTIDVGGPSNAIVRAPSGLLYVDRAGYPPTFAVIDPVARAMVDTVVIRGLNQVGEQKIGFVDETPFRKMTPPQITRAGDRLFTAHGEIPLGVLVIDPANGDLLATVDLNPRPDWDGRPQTLVLDESRGVLVATGEGVIAEISLADYRVIRQVPRPEPSWFAGEATITSAGRHLVVSASKNSSDEREAWVVDLESFSIIERMRRRPPSSGTAGFAWRLQFALNGRMVFAATGSGIEAWLHRR